MPHDPEFIVPAEPSLDAMLEIPDHPVTVFLREENGAVILEYVTLLMGVFLSVSVTVKPLHDALMVFAANVYEHLHYP